MVKFLPLSQGTIPEILALSAIQGEFNSVLPQIATRQPAPSHRDRDPFFGQKSGLMMRLKQKDTLEGHLLAQNQQEIPQNVLKKQNS